MRSVCICVRRGGALLTLLAVLAVPAYAEESDPLEARVKPPIGAASTHEEPPGFFAWLLSWFQ